MKIMCDAFMIIHLAMFILVEFLMIRSNNETKAIRIVSAKKGDHPWPSCTLQFSDRRHAYLFCYLTVSCISHILSQHPHKIMQALQRFWLIDLALINVD